MPPILLFFLFSFMRGAFSIQWRSTGANNYCNTISARPQYGRDTFVNGRPVTPPGGVNTAKTSVLRMPWRPRGLKFEVKTENNNNKNDPHIQIKDDTYSGQQLQREG